MRRYLVPLGKLIAAADVAVILLLVVARLPTPVMVRPATKAPPKFRRPVWVVGSLLVVTACLVAVATFSVGDMSDISITVLIIAVGAAIAMHVGLALIYGYEELGKRGWRQAAVVSSSATVAVPLALLAYKLPIFGQITLTFTYLTCSIALAVLGVTWVAFARGTKLAIQVEAAGGSETGVAQLVLARLSELGSERPRGIRTAENQTSASCQPTRSLTSLLDRSRLRFSTSCASSVRGCLGRSISSCTRTNLRRGLSRGTVSQPRWAHRNQQTASVGSPSSSFVSLVSRAKFCHRWTKPLSIFRRRASQSALRLARWSRSYSPAASIPLFETHSALAVFRLARSHHLWSTPARAPLRPATKERCVPQAPQPISSNLRSPLPRLQPQHAVTGLDPVRGSPPAAMDMMSSRVADLDTNAGCVEFGCLSFGLSCPRLSASGSVGQVVSQA
jgi:hypothetical protein